MRSPSSFQGANRQRSEEEDVQLEKPKSTVRRRPRANDPFVFRDEKARVEETSALACSFSAVTRMPGSRTAPGRTAESQLRDSVLLVFDGAAPQLISDFAHRSL
jgi:hypothetical protein